LPDIPRSQRKKHHKEKHNRQKEDMEHSRFSFIYSSCKKSWIEVLQPVEADNRGNIFSLLAEKYPVQDVKTALKPISGILLAHSQYI
jgi:hypothetical protein